MSAPARSITDLDEKYRVIARVGRGGTADVNLAVARGPGGFNKLVVLKSLREEFRGVGHYLEMFLAEARLNAQLSHPHIVQTNEIFEFDGLPVIVMEFLEGQTLGAVVRMARKVGTTAAFDRSMHLRVLSDVLHALDYAHNKRGLDGEPLCLVHCDVTPQNVFLTYEGEIKLIDFGIARQLSAREGLAGRFVRGKARYMPPEQITGEGIDQRTDLYAVGAMAWEAAAGVRLWSDASDDEILHAVRSGEIPSPRSVEADVDPELERIVMRALAPNRDDRYSTALAMQSDLDQYLGISGTRLRSRDIGAAVSVLFADRRAQTQTVVADQLAKLAAGASEFRLVDLPRVSLASDLTPAPAPRTRGWALPLTAALLLSILLAFALVLGTSPRTPPPEPTSAALAPASPGSVELRITAFPADAVLTLDGKNLGANPYRGTYERSPATRELWVSAPGYEPATRSLTLADSVDVVVTLQAHGLPSSEPAPTRTLPLGAVPHSAEVRRDASPSAPGCDPPAYFDEKGIKHFKPHCL